MLQVSAPLLILYFTADEAWIKLTSIRDQRKKMEKKIADSKKSGAGADDVVKPTMWWYELAAFLSTDTTAATTTDNLHVSLINSQRIQSIVLCTVYHQSNSVSLSSGLKHAALPGHTTDPSKVIAVQVTNLFCRCRVAPVSLNRQALPVFHKVCVCSP